MSISAGYIEIKQICEHFQHKFVFSWIWLMILSRRFYVDTRLDLTLKNGSYSDFYFTTYVIIIFCARNYKFTYS